MVNEMAAPPVPPPNYLQMALLSQDAVSQHQIAHFSRMVVVVVGKQV